MTHRDIDIPYYPIDGMVSAAFASYFPMMVTSLFHQDRLSCSRLTRSSLTARAPIRLNMPFRGALQRPQRGLVWDFYGR